MVAKTRWAAGIGAALLVAGACSGDDSSRETTGMGAAGAGGGAAGVGGNGGQGAAAGAGGAAASLPAPMWLLGMSRGPGQIYLGWRLDAAHEDVGYVVYRSEQSGSGYVALNEPPITDSTNYLDESVVDGTTYYYVVRAVADVGEPSPPSNEVSVAAGAAAGTVYRRIDAMANDTLEGYARLGDVDGDGLLDFLVKSQQAVAGDDCPSYPTQIWLYDHAGSLLWHHDTNMFTPASYLCSMWCSSECPSSCIDETHSCSDAPGCCHGSQADPGYFANSVPWSLWDLDGDGRAEAFGFDKIGDDHMAVVLDGETGISLGQTLLLDSYQRRQFVVAHLDGVSPSILLEAGEYPTNEVRAYDSSWTPLWTAVSTGDAAHYLRVADLDGDGFDEVLDGAHAIDHDGSDLWTKGFGHGDSAFVADVQPDHAGLEVLVTLESQPGVYLLAAETGDVLWQDLSLQDTAGWCAELRPSLPGMECYVFDTDPWGYRLYDAYGTVLETSGSSLGNPIDWTGDDVDELLCGTGICDGASLQPVTQGIPYGIQYAVDLIGDYREEVMAVAVNHGTLFLEVHTNTEPLSARAASPWEDRVYRENRTRSILHEGFGIE